MNQDRKFAALSEPAGKCDCSTDDLRVCFSTTRNLLHAWSSYSLVTRTHEPPPCKWSIVSIQILGHGRLSMIMVKPAILRAFTGQHGHPNLWEPIGPSNNQCSWNRTIVLYSILAKVVGSVLEGHFVWFYFSIFCVFCWNLHAVQSHNYNGTICLTNTETPKFHTSIQYSTLAVHLFSRHFSRLITITWMQRGSRK
jgi:hypothetical protein